MLNKEAQRFMNIKIVKQVLQDFELDDITINRLNKFFENKTSKSCENFHKTIANFVLYRLNNYNGRIRRLKNIKGTTKYSQLLRYGRENFLNIIKIQADNKTRHFKSRKQYWLDLGYSMEESILLSSNIQKERSLISAEKSRGCSEHSCRSLLFWIKKGFSEEEAKKKIKEIQTTNGLEFYIKKYGDSGIDIYNDRISRWLYSFNDKSDEEMSIINKKKGFSIEGSLLRGLTEEESIELYKNKCDELSKKRKTFCSKICQLLTEKIDEKLNGKSYYYAKNYEYLINGYRVDYYNKEHNLVVELYGTFYHRDPRKYTSDSIFFNIKSSDKWEYDKKRENSIKKSSKVKHFVIVWEDDFRKNPTEVIKQILKQIGVNDDY